jgi:hypothetical protein
MESSSDDLDQLAELAWEALEMECTYAEARLGAWADRWCQETSAIVAEARAVLDQLPPAFWALEAQALLDELPILSRK